MERRLQTMRNIHHIKGKTYIISNQLRTRQLGARTLDIHHPLGKKQQQDNYIQRLLSGKYSRWVSRKNTVIKQQWRILKQLNRKEHSNDVIINDRIQAIKEKQKTITK